MSLGRRSSERQASFWVASDKLGTGPRNAFYDRLNELLAEMDFDRGLDRLRSRTTRRPGVRAFRLASTSG